MRKHGWQLPYHPLQVRPLPKFRVFTSGWSSLPVVTETRSFVFQVVAVSVFLALAFAFYVFFAPFVGRKVFQYVVMGIYTPLVRFLFRFCRY
jgi:palmitoyltransferase ZDHHC1/11